MKKLLLALLLGSFLISGLVLVAQAQDTQKITINVRCWARPPMESWRGNNFLLAAEELNADLEAAGDPRRVEVKIVQNDPRDWNIYLNEFVMGFGAGEAPDIWLTGHEYIGAQAEAGRILALDDLLKEFPSFDLIIDTLWDSVRYTGAIYGVPQDAEARPLYWNKDLLKQLGWSDEEIAALPEKIKDGVFTLYDMLQVAKEAVDAGIVKEGNGFWTRPKNGPDFTAFYYAFGGETIDPTSGKLVFDKAAGLKYYKFFYDAAQNYGSMGGLGVGWSNWHTAITNGEVLFWVGGSWQWAEWAEEYLKAQGGEDYLWEHFGFGLIPAAEKGGQPKTLTHPLVYTVSAQCRHPDLAVALIAKVTAYGPNTRHALSSNHMGILKNQMNYKFYKQNRMIKEGLYMLNYTTFLPNNPNWSSYSNVLYEALRGVVSGSLTPDEAVNFAVNGLKRELGDEVIIR